MKKQRGITLIGLVVTIIILLILAGVTVITLTGDNGLLTKAGEAKNTSEKGEIEEQIKLAYNDWKLRKETGETSKLKDTMETRLRERYGNDVSVSEIGRSVVVNVKNYEVTLVDDGTIEEGKLACLDIADGNIDLYSNGYKQYTGNLQGLHKNGVTTYTGKYIITGTTTENVVRVCDEGNYDITIKNLTIDISGKNELCAFNANRGCKPTGCYVDLKLEEKNVLKGGNSAAALGFTNGTPNINGVKNGSTLTIDGEGYLEARSIGFGAAIGSGYSGYEVSEGLVSNIIINGGNISAYNENFSHGAGIGAALYGNANNIIINGGNIYTKAGFYCPAIGGTSEVDNIIINGGNIQAYTTGFTTSIGSRSNTHLGTIKITGGNIIATGTNSKSYNYEAIGHGMKNIIIEGGTIKTDSSESAGIFKNEENNVKIIGGNLQLGGVGDIGTLDSDKNFVQGFSTDGTNTLYKTPIKLQDVGENKQITKLTTSDNINYGTKDMYTLEDGMLYLYLPTGTRTITITTEDGKTYSGTVETKETSETATLTQIN